MQLFYPDHTSVLQPELLVKWKRSRGAYNFDLLPSRAVICGDYSLIKQFVTFRTKKIKGLKGRHFIKNDVLFCSEFDNGAPGIIKLLEELKALGVTQFVFAGFAGMITDKVREGNIYSIEKAVSGVNATAYYSDKNELYPYDRDYFEKITKALNIQSSTCFSIDTPFRETRPLLDELAKKDIHLIDMECAAILAFAAFYHLSATCFLIAADNLTGDWCPPRDWNDIQNRLKQSINKISSIL